MKERKRLKGNAEDNVINSIEYSKKKYSESLVFDLLGICSAQSSCRYEVKNGLSVVGEVSWRVVLVTSFGPASLASYDLILRSPRSPPFAVRPDHFLCLFDLFCKSSKVTPATPA
ncbi:hypothetical protein BYT27DRAFT_7184379, partial [Phlegmacium glaucopus]